MIPHDDPLLAWYERIPPNRRWLVFGFVVGTIAGVAINVVVVIACIALDWIRR